MFGWGRKKEKENQKLPTIEKEPERYQGKPLLILLENWILHTTGELDDSKAESMRNAVQKAYGAGDDWARTLRNVLQFEDGIEDAIRALWQQNLHIAKQNGMQLHPIQFSKMMVDSNFKDFLD